MWLHQPSQQNQSRQRYHPSPAPNQNPRRKSELREDIVYDMTNEYREVVGIRPLDRIFKIEQITISHSKDMPNETTLSMSPLKG